jgi:DNA-binding CsgD family transcriptional regulator
MKSRDSFGSGPSRKIGNHPVLLCGFGVVEADMAQSRIVIVMQVTGSAFWHKRVLGQSKEKFQLTWREAHTLQHLLKGWTNKEIGNTLSISEQTVKEHVKHLLAKMCVTTRTGIVMKAVLCGVEYETQPIPSNSMESAFLTFPVTRSLPIQAKI